MSNYCYLNGKILPEDEAKISVNDIGVLRGFGVFDFLRSYDGKPFLLEKHLARLENSAKNLNLKLPISKKEIGKIIQKLLKKNKLINAGIRIVITGGKSADGICYNCEKPTFFILVKKLPNHPAHLYRSGVKLMTVEHQREKAEAKSNNYLTMVSVQARKINKKAIEILYVSNGCILEGGTCNFFIFKGNTLVTAKDDILKGTRRGIVLELAKKKFKVEERPLKLPELKKASEAFVTSTTKDILPVVKIDDYKIDDGKVGKNTKCLMNLFAEYIKKFA